jgi:DNA-binding MarR family transcriptional regulator
LPPNKHHTNKHNNGTPRNGTSKRRPPAQAGDAVDFGALPGYIGFNLRQAQAASFRHLEWVSRDLDLTPGQFSLLMLLEANPGASQKSISRAIGVDTSTLSPVLDALARRDLLIRRRLAHDRRTYALTLTPAGRRALTAMRAHIESQERLLSGALGPGESALLRDMLKRVTAALKATT